jgi:hypothetical protein
MHADAVFRGGSFRWAQYFDPAPATMQRFDDAAQTNDFDWETLEPQYLKP